MENLSEIVKNEQVSWSYKKASSLHSKQELYVICADKANEYVKEMSIQTNPNLGLSPSKRGKMQLPNVLSAISEG